jgi:glycosyltransferase involved in cell wall biosynthesis
MARPLVSVIMNCFNGERYLREAIDSVLAQTCKDWEIVFWDNQSEDRSAEIVKSYADPRIHYHYASSHTLLYEARNYAIERASGEYFAFLDVDDWWFPEKLERQVALFGDPEVGMVCGNFWVVNERRNKRWRRFSRAMPTGKVLNDLLKTYYVGLLTLVVKRGAFESLSYPCDPRYHIIGDFDLVVRLAMKWKLDCVQEPVACYRLHGSNETPRQRQRYIDELKTWLDDVGEREPVKDCSNVRELDGLVTYLQGVDEVLKGEKASALPHFNRLCWGTLKLRLLFALLAPLALSRYLKN